MSKVTEQRDPSGNANTEVPDDVPEVYADGIAGAHIGVPNSRLSFYVVVDPIQTPGGIEGRRVKHSVVMPTAALLQFVENFHVAFAANAGRLEEATKASAAIFSKLAEQAKGNS
ncbi:hypothetical protein [Paraburkholderia fungorum]|uniref:hypothetical protein n=1 Tax=Paraburkholderia fungorum TaxID=134537 RepID=UPI003877EFC2